MNFFNEQLLLIQNQFHWIRPFWLLALIPSFFCFVLLWRHKRKAYQWQQLVAPELLPYLIDGNTVQAKKYLLWGLLLMWTLGAIALAGPSWEKRPTPVEKNQAALVILLDLSYSMISEDIKPSRIARARLKIADILRERKDGLTALIAYAGEAHTVTPLSDDNATILSLLTSMHPNIMPLQGSNTEAAVERGLQLLRDAGATQGDLLLVTDGVVPEAFDIIRTLIAGKKIHLDILGVGSTQAAPIPNAKGGFLQDSNGKILTTQLNSAELSQLAQSLNSRFHELVNSNDDINYLKPREYKDAENSPKIEREFDQWVDNGFWLVFILLPMVLFCFRRGVLLSFIIIPFLGFTPSETYAYEWKDLWLTKDQQAQQELKKGDAKKAAEQFQSPDWKASALYKSGDYAAAANEFSKNTTATGHYNRGNALAKSGKLQDALKAYDEALKLDPTLNDAKANRETVEKLLKDQEKNKQDKNQDSDQQNKDQQNKNDQNNQKDENKQDSSDKQSNGSSSNDTNEDNQSKDGKGSSSASNQQQSNDQRSGSSNSSSASQPSAQGQSSSASSTAQQSGQMNSSSSSSQPSSPPKEKVDLSNEQQQALEQWLRRVPDDPGGLLRNKFRHQYEQNLRKERDGNFQPPENHADQRL